MENTSTVLTPLRLSPEQVHNSPHGNAVAYDVLFKEPAGNKVIQVYSPCNSKKLPIDEKLRSAEERKKNKEMEKVMPCKEKGKKIENIRRQILESIENQKKQILENYEKKIMTAEEIKNSQRKEFEEKIQAKQTRAEEAKKLHEEHIENKRKLAEQKLAQLQLAEELREASKKAKVEKAKIELEKSEAIRAENQKKIEQLGDKLNKDLDGASKKRDARLSEISEKCKKHVEDCKRRAATIETQKANRPE